MKAIIFFISIAFTGSLAAQYWSPILVNEKMNYQHSDSIYISHTIWVDSVETIGIDVIYYLNRIVKDVPDNPEIVLKNQPQFLLKQMNMMEAGIYTFNNPDEFTIKALAANGETWVFDEQMNIIAEITSISMENVFGVQDSVKYISLSDGNEIRLSKSFGITKFPDFENGGNYELVGIQNTDYGESVPDFWDIFDFEVGDVFQMYSYYSDAYYATIIEWNKSKINTKEVFADHYTYNIYRITKGIQYSPGGYVTYYCESYVEDVSYYLEDNQLTNKFQNDPIKLSLWCSFTGDPIYYSRIKVYSDPYGLLNKQWGTLETGYAEYEELFYQYLPQSDTLYDMDEIECLSDNFHGMRYTESLGNTFTYYCDHFEVYYYSYLMGYIRDGDTVGTIYSDSLLLVGMDSQNPIHEDTCIVYPNPADKNVNFKFKELNTHNEISIEIRNLQGQILKQLTRVKAGTIALDVESLARGIYLYTIKSNEIVVQQGKLVIQ